MISVAILTKDSAETLLRTLQSTREFKEVILLDTGSIDDTLKIASTFSNIKIYKSPFLGFGPLHNLAATYATYDWILSLDSDEVLSEEFQQELLKFPLDPHMVFSFPFHNYLGNKHIKCCGWYPDRHVRLYNKKITSFSEDHVHEKVIQKGLVEKKLSTPILHFSYRSISDFLKKMENYSHLFAKQNQHKKRSSMGKAILHGSYSFFKSYILQRGFLGGAEGFLISVYNGQTSFYKYLKLKEYNNKNASHSSLS
ncbi:MAG: glycosyltransferase family 2 protein [Simkania negevensis]|nr:glycosyltransferase family 2 protein [Simkania negevensis]